MRRRIRRPMKWTPVFGCFALIGAAASSATATAAQQVARYAISHPRYGVIGTYDRTSDESDGVTRVAVRLRVVVKILGLVVHREAATQAVAWRGDQLLSFQSVTITNGRRLNASGEARGNRFLVTSPSGIAVAPLDVVASDPWSLNRLGHGTVVSIRTGKIDPVEVTGGEPDTVTLHGVSVRVRHFHVNTPAQLNKWEVWLNQQGAPIKFRSLESGAPIDFTLVSASRPTGDRANPIEQGKTK